MAKREGYISWDEFFMGAAMLCAEAAMTLMTPNISMFATQNLTQSSTAGAEALQEAEFMLPFSLATNVQKQ